MMDIKEMLLAQHLTLCKHLFTGILVCCQWQTEAWNLGSVRTWQPPDENTIHCLPNQHPNRLCCYPFSPPVSISSLNKWIAFVLFIKEGSTDNWAVTMSFTCTALMQRLSFAEAFVLMSSSWIRLWLFVLLRARVLNIFFKDKGLAQKKICKGCLLVLPSRLL